MSTKGTNPKVEINIVGGKCKKSKMHSAATSTVLSNDALDFVALLHRQFNPRRIELLKMRAETQTRIDAGFTPDFLNSTLNIRQATWKIAPIPDELIDRRVEITAPPERKMVINALNSGANTFMADFEDSHCPTWTATVQGQFNLFDAIRQKIEYTAPGGKIYRLNEEVATLFVRPRGWHLEEKHVTIDGHFVSASLFDFGIYFYLNAKELLDRGTRPYFYLPKLENHLEARLWNDVFVFSQLKLGIPKKTIKATVLIETILAAFEMDEILYELKDHSAGLNCGRWDYIFSVIKKFRNRPDFVLPDRGSITMNDHFLNSYSKLLIQTCHRRGAHAIGGMAAQIPIKNDPVLHSRAIEKVRSDKLREVKLGHDGTWVAHPALVPIAREIFDLHMRGPNQIQTAGSQTPSEPQTQARDLLEIPPGQITRKGLRTNIEVGLHYVAAWLLGNGCVPIDNLMEDTATAEISRAQVWQWLRHGKITQSDFLIEFTECRARLRSNAALASKLDLSAEIFRKLTSDNNFQEFLTYATYSQLEGDTTMTKSIEIETIEQEWRESSRWSGIKRNYQPADVYRFRGSIRIEHTLAKLGAERLWALLNSEEYLPALGALTGNQALQQVEAGLKVIYLSGWQVAADANLAGQMYPDQSLYPSDSVPSVVRKINNALLRADQIQHAEGKSGRYWLAPIVADAEAGFGGTLNAFELTKQMIEAGAAAVHFEDQLASAKKCGHLGGKVLIPTEEAIQKLQAARMAADVLGVPTVLIARTDANAAQLITSDIDSRDCIFLTGKRTREGFFEMNGGLDAAIARGLAYAPYADLIWCETSSPNLAEAQHFARAIHSRFPGKLLAYNCSPSFNWKKKLDEPNIAQFQKLLAQMGYKFQFVTLAGFHALNHSMFNLACEYKASGMTAYANFQEREFASEQNGYRATAHQRFVGTGYFDDLAQAIAACEISTQGLKGSTEEDQFIGGPTFQDPSAVA